MNSNGKIYLQILLISSFLILAKYLVSYFYIFNEDFLLKILRLEDIEYLFIVESLSRLDLKTDWSSFYSAEKIIGFPIFSVIWHSIFFIFFNYYSLIILGIIFSFILYLLIFKILCHLEMGRDKSFFVLISLVTIIQVLNFFGDIYEIEIFNLIYQPINEFVGSRFPRPLVTSIYLFSSIFCLQKISFNKDFSKSKRYLIFLSLFLSLLMNSYFYLFIVVSIISLIVLIYNFKSNIILLLKKNYYFLSLCLSIIISGFFILFLQSLYSESDYSNRIGMYSVNIQEKIYLLNHFFFKLFQIEIILLILISFILKFYFFKKLSTLKRNNDVIFYFFTSSLLAPFIFILFSNKMISLYHFWTIVKFSGFLFVFTSIFILIFEKFSNLYNSKYNIALIVIFLTFNILNSMNLEKNTTKNEIIDLKKIKQYLEKNNFKNTNIDFYTNDYLIKHLWLNLDNKYLTTIDGFSSSQSDKQLESVVLNIFKLFNIQNVEFVEILNETNKYGQNRNNFAVQYFNYKYSVNFIRHYKPLVNEYTNNEIKIIKNVSPLISYYAIIPNSEKIRLLNKYKKLNLDQIIYPDLIILKRNSFFNERSILGKYRDIYSNNNYVILKNDM